VLLYAQLMHLEIECSTCGEKFHVPDWPEITPTIPVCLVYVGPQSSDGFKDLYKHHRKTRPNETSPKTITSGHSLYKFENNDAKEFADTHHIEVSDMVAIISPNYP